MLQNQEGPLEKCFSKEIFPVMKQPYFSKSVLNLLEHTSDYEGGPLVRRRQSNVISVNNLYFL